MPEGLKEEDIHAEPSAHMRAKTGDARVRALDQAKVYGAATGLFGGVASATAGTLLTVAGWSVTDTGARRVLSMMGTTLFFLTIPLIIFGACCMDWADKDKAPGHSDVTPYEDDEGP